MRLTNIAQLRLPRGTVSSYGAPVIARRDRPLPVSFDQGRHVGAGDRPGSWMAISFRIDEVADAEELEPRIAAAWNRVVARHGTLTSVFARGASGGVELFAGEIDHAAPALWQEHVVSSTAPSALAVAGVVRDAFDELCRPYAEPSHRVCLVIPDDTVDDGPAPGTGVLDLRPIVVIGSDHAHVDMWSLVVAAGDLASELARPGALAERAPAASFIDHTRALEAMPEAPAEIRDAWEGVLRAGDGVMPRFPLDLGDVSTPRGEVVEVRDVLDAAGMAAFEREAAAQGVRATALALSALTRVTIELSGHPLRAVFPVHSRNESRWHDSVGWFITNAVIEIDDPTPAAAGAAVRQALRLGSYPLAPIFAPRGGMPQSPGMFAISWLDLRRLPVAMPTASDPHWVSAVIRTDGVMIWFVVDSGGMHLRCRYPDTVTARASVRAWLDAVVARIATEATGA